MAVMMMEMKKKRSVQQAVCLAAALMVVVVMATAPSSCAAADDVDEVVDPAAMPLPASCYSRELPNCDDAGCQAMCNNTDAHCNFPNSCCCPVIRRPAMQMQMDSSAALPLPLPAECYANQIPSCTDEGCERMCESTEAYCNGDTTCCCPAPRRQRHS